MKQALENEVIRNHRFLSGMYDDPYFPNALVEKGRGILIRLCTDIESTNPKSLDELYQLSHGATEGFNDLEEDFLQAGSEIETVAREVIAADFEFVARAYGFAADVESLIAPRNW